MCHPLFKASFRLRGLILSAYHPFVKISISFCLPGCTAEYIHILNIRLAKVRSLDIELEGCADSSCKKNHTVKEWPVLEQICDHLGSNLKEMVFYLSACTEDCCFGSDLWIVRFAKEMTERGITSCTAVYYLNDGFAVDYHWAASTSESSLVNLMRRTVRGSSPSVKIWGSQDAALRVPADVLEVLSGLAENGLFFLYTNIKIQSLANLEYLNKCPVLELHNRAAIEDEEVEAMNGILAQVAVDPRPRNPHNIFLPKVNKQYPP